MRTPRVYACWLWTQIVSDRLCMYSANVWNSVGLPIWKSRARDNSRFEKRAYMVEENSMCTVPYQRARRARSTNAFLGMLVSLSDVVTYNSTCTWKGNVCERASIRMWWFTSDKTICNCSLFDEKNREETNDGLMYCSCDYAVATVVYYRYLARFELNRDAIARTHRESNAWYQGDREGKLIINITIQ